MIQKYRLDPNCYYRIYDFKNRSGENVDEVFKKDLREYSNVWRKINSKFREKDTLGNKVKGIHSLCSYEAKDLLCKLNNEEVSEVLKRQLEDIIDTINSDKKIYKSTKNRIHSWLRRVKKQIILERLCEFEDAWLSGKDNITLKSELFKFEEKEKPVFCLNNKMFSFPLAVVNQQLKMKYSICPADRNTVMKQLDLILQMNDVNLGVLRLDIKSFYESIPFDVVINNLEKDSLVDNSVIGVIKEVRNVVAEAITSNSQGQENTIGLPRGLSISAYLSEYYMKDFDNAIRMLDNVVFYSRYVDDIIVVICDAKGNQSADRLNKVEDDIKNLLVKYKLSAYFDPSSAKYYKGNDKLDFNYLGYKITRGKTQPVVYSMSKNKIEKYKMHIDRCFNAYLKALRVSGKEKDNSRLQEKRKKALKVLILRLRLLTGRVLVPIIGGYVFVGISESYPLISSNDQSIVELDKYLDEKIRNTGKLSTVFTEDKLFSKAFNTNQFFKINPKKIGEVKRWLKAGEKE